MIGPGMTNSATVAGRVSAAANSNERFCAWMDVIRRGRRVSARDRSGSSTMPIAMPTMPSGS